MPDTETMRFRLPPGVAPTRYQLTLRPDLAAGTFTGTAAISLDIALPVREIVLNAVELSIHSATVARGDGQPIAAQAIQLDGETERATLTFGEVIEAGAWVLDLTFDGTLNDKLRGFYRSRYTDDRGNEQLLATTQFESTDARRAFPCWDEPAFKAVFTVTLIVDQGLTAIANGAMESEHSDPATGKRVVVFADTPPMSTYLVAFIVGRLESSRTIDVDGVPLRLWAVPGKGGLDGFALGAGEHALRFFSRYYDIPYPAAKMDLLAIPDFASGAMENLGAITFREALLLLDEGTATLAELQRVAEVEAHEIAHMWFGDLVTMLWWNGLWLKEAFATFMELLSVNDFKPEWDVWTSFGVARAAAMTIDGLHSTRPIEYPVLKPEDAAGMYDVLTYEKGAAVLRMCEQWLGPATFRGGITAYLNAHAFANAETTDLWDALEHASEEPVRAVMDSWIFQPGYPLISAELVDSELVLSQERFLYRRDGTPSDQLWQTPVTVRVADGSGRREQKLLLAGRTSKLPMPAGLRSVVVNSGGDGVYRVRYSPQLLASLTADGGGTLSPIERFNLISDSWANVQAGYTPLAEHLDLSLRFVDERDRSVWTALLGPLGAVRRIVAQPQLPAFQALVRRLLRAINELLGWEPVPGESELQRQLRGQILAVLGTLGNDAAVQEEARVRHTKFVADPASVDPEVAAASIAVVASNGGSAEYDEIWHRFKHARTPQDERRYQNALSEFHEPALLARTLDHAVDGEIRTQDAPFMIASVMVNRDGGELAWAFVRDRWDELLQRFPDNTIMRMVDGIVALTRPAQAAEIEAFFQTHRVPDAGKRLDQALERLRIGVDFRQRESANLAAYLTESASEHLSQ